MKQKTFKNQGAFTIVELLIVIVVIAILVAISIVAYSGIQERARSSKIAQDLNTLERAIMVARETSSKTLFEITGHSYSAGSCTGYPANTNFATLPKTEGCWVRYLATLNAISEAGGVNVQELVDPWGRPYFIDENEGEGGGCGLDVIAVYAYPFNGSSRRDQRHIPLSGLSGCAL